MFSFFLLACSAEPTAAPAAPAPAPAASTTPAGTSAAPVSRKIDSAALKADLDAKKVPILVDVRSPDEFAGGHVPGAKNIPIADLDGRVGELATYKGGPVYLICASGGRSARGAAMLASQGFEAVNVGDGTSGWVAAGFPVER